MAKITVKGAGGFFTYRKGAHIGSIFRPASLALMAAALLSCGKNTSSTTSAFDLSYALGRQYTGEKTNTLTIDVINPGDDQYTFSLASPNAQTSVAQDTKLPLSSQTITFTYEDQGVYSADFKVARRNGTPFIFEVLAWEHSVEVPDEPIISFAKSATRSQSVSLLVSESRTDNTSGIWLSGDIGKAGKFDTEDDGFWEEFPLTSVALPVTLTAGDGLKTVNAKFRNVFGNPSELAIPAQILLKQSPPSGCDAVPLSTTINSNKLNLLMSVTDPYQTYFSAFGDVIAITNQNPFKDGDVVSVFLVATVGQKTVNITITDIAGNTCFDEDITVTIDPTFEQEGIMVQGSNYYAASENIVVDIYFDHTADQEPLQLKITGDVSGPNTNSWIPYAENLPITLAPTTSGSRRIFAQYKDAANNESYLITRRIFLKPTVTLQDIGAPNKNVIISNIVDADSITITGCVETYNNVAYAAAYFCQPLPGPGTITVTYHFPDDTTLVKSAP